MKAALVLLAAGASRRFGRLKQLEPVGPGGEALMDYTIRDALGVGFGAVIVVVRHDIEDAVQRHLSNRWSGVPISFAYQTTPQGTAHALLCAEPLIRGPFAVANADDFYGADAWERAGAWLAGPLEPIDAAVVTYRLDATLSPYGGVSRAVCRTGAEGRVEGITELLDVRRVDGRIVGREEGRAEREVPPDSPTSMNLWVLQAAIFAPLQDRFRQFLAAERGDTDEEFRLSTEMNALLRAGRVRIRSLRTSAPWMGVTYAADGPFVRERIAALVQAGVYPASLRADSKERTG